MNQVTVEKAVYDNLESMAAECGQWRELAALYLLQLEDLEEPAEDWTHTAAEVLRTLKRAVAEHVVARNDGERNHLRDLRAIAKALYAAEDAGIDKNSDELRDHILAGLHEWHAGEAELNEQREQVDAQLTEALSEVNLLLNMLGVDPSTTRTDLLSRIRALKAVYELDANPDPNFKRPEFTTALVRLLRQHLPARIHERMLYDQVRWVVDQWCILSKLDEFASQGCVAAVQALVDDLNLYELGTHQPNEAVGTAIDILWAACCKAAGQPPPFLVPAMHQAATVLGSKCLELGYLAGKRAKQENLPQVPPAQTTPEAPTTSSTDR